MNVSLILGHPRTGSLCHALAEAAANALRANGHALTLHDLYAEGFDPVMKPEESVARVSNDPLVEQHCAELAAAEGLVVVHPNWWGQPPAILKGWIDRVVRPGVAYDLLPGPDGARTKHVGRLQVRTALILNTSDLPLEVERTRFGNTLDAIWKSYVAALGGIPDAHRISYGVVGTSTPELRAAWLNDARAAVAQHFPRGAA